MKSHSKKISAVACSLTFLAASALFAEETETQDNFYYESLGTGCEIRSELAEDQECEITDNQDVAKCETCESDNSNNKKNKKNKEGKCGQGKCGEGKCGK